MEEEAREIGRNMKEKKIWPLPWEGELWRKSKGKEDFEEQQNTSYLAMLFGVENIFFECYSKRFLKVDRQAKRVENGIELASDIQISLK